MSAEPLDDIPIDEQIQAIEELLHLSGLTYPQWVENGDISQATMDEELGVLRAVIATLRRVKEHG